MLNYRGQIWPLPINPTHANMENHLDMVVIEVLLKYYYRLKIPAISEKSCLNITNHASSFEKGLQEK